MKPVLIQFYLSRGDSFRQIRRTRRNQAWAWQTRECSWGRQGSDRSKDTPKQEAPAIQGQANLTPPVEKSHDPIYEKS